MTTAYWIVAGLTALAFLAAGAFKLVRPKQALAASGLAWVEDFSPASIKLIGLAEVVGAVGLVVPAATGVAPVLSPVAAVCLALLMVGATVVHVRRSEPPISAGPLVLSVAAAVLGFLAIA
ncbi:DoxX family protein [Cellulomonas sp. APG4]|uniref:DoxX family protein n=1 Tax=Cellulomonas sp. APG4 TaxID=1538656 RepID=UPI00137A8B8D|nr:DoxX family protein [Cellulomonas sp. APG4]NCT92582.1 DoxX family protein [Cellulomonas sp. APG4]